MIIVKCVHCGEYELTSEQIEQYRMVGLLRGFQCFICSEECYVFHGKVRIYPNSEQFGTIQNKNEEKQS